MIIRMINTKNAEFAKLRFMQKRHISGEEGLEWKCKTFCECHTVKCTPAFASKTVHHKYLISNYFNLLQLVFFLMQFVSLNPVALRQMCKV